MSDDLIARLRKDANYARLHGVYEDGPYLDNIADAIAEQAAQIERLTRERDEALRELHMKWCMACGTLTNDDDCDCTMYNGDASLQELRPYIEEYQRSMIECLSKAEGRATTAEHERDEARAEVERKDAALSILAEPANWRMGGLCDPNSGAFVGQAIARAALTKGGENGDA